MGKRQLKKSPISRVRQKTRKQMCFQYFISDAPHPLVVRVNPKSITVLLSTNIRGKGARRCARVYHQKIPVMVDFSPLFNRNWLDLLMVYLLILLDKYIMNICSFRKISLTYQLISVLHHI